MLLTVANAEACAQYMAWCRKRNGIKADSKLKIITADQDLYLAEVDDKLFIKLGPRYDLGDKQPGQEWQLATAGNDFAIWERKL